MTVAINTTTTTSDDITKPSAKRVSGPRGLSCESKASVTEGLRLTVITPQIKDTPAFLIGPGLPWTGLGKRLLGKGWWLRGGVDGGQGLGGRGVPHGGGVLL
jgi:hypothetical protein